MISLNTPLYPENYIHRIGRTGRAGQAGKAILLYSPQEVEYKDSIEKLMNYSIPFEELPAEVEISTTLIPEEKPKVEEAEELRNDDQYLPGASFHEKKDKNKKTNQKESYQQQLKKKYKKPIRRGDKIQNMKSKRKKK